MRSGCTISIVIYDAAASGGDDDDDNILKFKDIWHFAEDLMRGTRCYYSMLICVFNVNSLCSFGFGWVERQFCFQSLMKTMNFNCTKM